MGKFFETMDHLKTRNLTALALGAVYFVVLLSVSGFRALPFLGPFLISIFIGLLTTDVKEALKASGFFLIGSFLGFALTFTVKFLIATSVNQGAVSHVGLFSTLLKMVIAVLVVGLIPWTIGLPLGAIARRKLHK